MADDITGKFLKKKVLDRWENEGGRTIADQAGADECSPTIDHEGGLNQLSGSHGNSTVGAPISATKELKPTEK